MSKRILCLSRSYLSRLLPMLGQRDSANRYFHIVQTDQEANVVRAAGGEVVLNLESLVREGLTLRESPVWVEPADFRRITGFEWSPIYADRYLPSFAPPLRLRIAGLLQQGVQKLFREQRFDAFLSEPVALFITHLLFYHCRAAGVQSLLWANSYFPGHFYFADDSHISRPVRRQPLDAAHATALRETIERYVRGVIGDQAGPVYHHAFSGAAASKKLGYFKQRRGELPLVLRPGWSSRAIQALRLARVSALRLGFPRHSDYMSAGAVAEHRFYMRCLLTPRSYYDELPTQHSSRNVMFPLQFEPEASLLYFAPEVVDQYSYVESLLRALPGDRVLWVKEHPNQFGALGDARWRRLRRRYHNLRFIFGRESGRELIKRCSLVVTISSTAGLDGMLLGRRVLVSGRVFYNAFTGAIPVSSYAELAQRLNDPSNYEVADTAAANVEELFAFGLHCYPGDPQPAATLFSERNLDDLCTAIRLECAHEPLAEPSRVHGT